MPFSDDQLDQHIRRRPSVHRICLGAFLQHAMFVTADVVAVPLSAVGFDGIARLVADYLSADLELPFPQKEFDELVAVGRDAHPGTVLVWHAARDATTDELLRSSDRSFRRAQSVLAVATGDRMEIVAQAVLHAQDHKYQLLPAKSRRRQRLWFSIKEAEEFEQRLVSLAESAESDSRIALALQLYSDAINDRSDEFRLIKLYNVLECLASTEKSEGVDDRPQLTHPLE